MDRTITLETIVAPYVRSGFVQSSGSKKNAPPATGFYCRAAILRAAIQTRVASGRVGDLREGTASLLFPYRFLETPSFSYIDYSIIVVRCQDKNLNLVRFICVDTEVTRAAFPAIPSHRRLDLLFSLAA